MDILTDSRRVNRLEVVETGRRRRWSDVEKLRIVEESFSGPRLVSETARRHGLSKQLLFSWRKAYREGQLGRSRCQVDGFVPARIVSEFPSTTERAAPAARHSGGRDREWPTCDRGWQRRCRSLATDHGSPSNSREAGRRLCWRGDLEAWPARQRARLAGLQACGSTSFILQVSIRV